MAVTATALTIVDRVEQSPAIAMLNSRSQALLDLLPDQSAVDRFQRIVVQAMVKNPDLLSCTPDSVVIAVFEAAAQGLEPTGAAGGAHLVPYNQGGTKVAQLIPDFRGVIRMVTKPGSEVVSLEARVVKEGDAFAYQLGTDAFVEHTPSLEPGRSTKATTHVYAVARLRGGSTIPDVEDRAGIERVQNRSTKSSKSPWATDWDEMAKKTIIKRLAKVLPVHPDVRSILVREDELSDEAPAAAVAPPKGPTKAARLADRIKDVTPKDQPASDAPGQDDDVDAAFAAPEGENAAAAPAEVVEGEAREVASVDVVGKLRELVSASGLVGDATDPQKARIRVLIPLVGGADAFRPVVVAAFGPSESGKATAAQAQAILTIADSLDEAAFVAAWTAAAEATAA